MARVLIVVMAIASCISTLGAAPSQAIADSTSQKQTVIRDRISAAVARRLARASACPNTDLKLENEALRKELAELRRGMAERDSLLKSVNAQNVGLRYKLTQVEAEAQIELSGELAEERQRVATYMTRTDAQLAEIKSGLSQISIEVAAVDRASRIDLARAIVKSRQHRRALRTVEELRRTVAELTGAKHDPGIEIVTRSTIRERTLAGSGKGSKRRYASKRKLTMAR